MPIAQGMLNELNNEAAITRSVLEAIPEDAAEWRPHPKSYSLGELSVHLVNVLKWGAVTLKKPEFDMAPVDGEAWTPPSFTTREALIAEFDANVATTRAALGGTSDESMMKEWRLLKGGETIMAMPRVAVMRTMIFNHLVHHRGQLSVYLRLRDVPLPRIYGPSADNP